MQLTHPIKLGINIDHVATLRQARRGPYPDPLYAALVAEQNGADSITLHLREDRRHIQDHDVHRMRAALQTRMNLEHEASSGAPIQGSRSYRYALEGGAEPVDGVAEGTLIFCGASLLSLAHEELDDARSLADARRLLRAALDRLLDGRSLRTREVLLEMRAHAGQSQGV